ncbi:unnamed protein product [Cyclocybe aegerita]|uniref:Uncharacterized protein n=1 Tax=Cyclocybe aegerita TaxID=1973307 RepID=A0A8S0W778_CYCAE|nr:unnamed protein product [Cyclocybe aegerita]
MSVKVAGIQPEKLSAVFLYEACRQPRHLNSRGRVARQGILILGIEDVAAAMGLSMGVERPSTIASADAASASLKDERTIHCLLKHLEVSGHPNGPRKSIGAREGGTYIPLGRKETRSRKKLGLGNDGENRRHIGKVGVYEVLDDVALNVQIQRLGMDHRRLIFTRRLLHLDQPVAGLADLEGYSGKFAASSPLSSRKLIVERRFNLLD